MSTRKPPNAGRGRTKGVPNKATSVAREMFAELLEANADKAQGWLDQVAADDPKGALDLLIKLGEYVVPKLSRTHITAAPGKDPVPGLLGLLWDDSDGGPGVEEPAAPNPSTPDLTTR